MGERKKKKKVYVLSDPSLYTPLQGDCCLVSSTREILHKCILKHAAERCSLIFETP